MWGKKPLYIKFMCEEHSMTPTDICYYIRDFFCIVYNTAMLWSHPQIFKNTLFIKVNASIMVS